MALQFSKYGPLFQVFCLLFVYAHNGTAQYKKASEVYIDQPINELTIKEIFDLIESITEFDMLYVERDLNLEVRISLTPEDDKSVYNLLKEISRQSRLKFRKENNVIAASRFTKKTKKTNKGPFEIIQNVDIVGKITDETKQGLPGVNVMIKGTADGTVTDLDGNYQIIVPSSETILVYSYIGYNTQEVEVRAKEVIDVSLMPYVLSLSEVVVTALGLSREKDALGYSLTRVKGEEFSTVKQTSAINALQGKVAGVNVVNNSTGAAGSSRVIIRGASSLTGNNQPLYVVDGIPIGNQTNGAAGLWGGNDGGDGISSINPDDIASVSVLKSGAASALYGSRASGGVILITTKSGKEQQGIGVEFSSSLTFSNVNTSLRDTQIEYGQGSFGEKPVNEEDARQQARSSWGGRLDDSMVVQWDGVERPYRYVGSNLDHFFKTGSTLINTLAIGGGTDKFDYRFSFSDLSNKDVMPNSSLDRKTFSLNAGAVLGNKLTTRVNVKYILEDVHNRPRLSSPAFNANFTAGTLSPNVDIRTMNPGTNVDGTERRFSANPFFINPYFTAYNYSNEDQKNRIITSTSLRYDVLNWLSISGRVGADYYTIDREEVLPWGSGPIPKGALWKTQFQYTQMDLDLMLQIEKDITDKFSVNALIGTNSNYVKDEKFVNLGINFIVPGFEDISNTESQSPTKTFGERKIGSVYGSVEFSYLNYFYLTITGRNDWFSTLSLLGKTQPNNDFYPSVNTSFILSEAITMPEFIRFLKLGGGYSVVAGGADEPYQLTLTYDFFANHEGQPLAQINAQQVPNANLMAFSKRELEFGLNAQLFDGKLSLDLSFYNSKTTNDIVPVNASFTSGYVSALSNLGIVENEGFEFLISGTPINTNGFKWITSLNGAYNKGIVVATNNENDNITLGIPRTLNIEIAQIVGQPFGTLFGNAYTRDADGNILYEIDSDGVPLAVLGEKKILGEGVPPWTFGFSNTLTYKNFTLNFLISGKFGGQVFSGTNTRLTQYGLHKQTLEGREDGLTVSGINAADNTPFTTTVAPQNLQTYWGRIAGDGGIAEHFVEDSDYIKFRQLRLGYDLPTSLLQDSFLNNLNISFFASDLFFIKRSVENIDPESDYQTGNAQGLDYFGVPSSRSFGLSVKVGF